MNESIKNLIGLVAVIATLAISYASYQYIQIYDRSSEPTNFRSFAVSAQGEINAVPDVAQFSFSVVTEGGENVGDLQQKNTEKMDAAITFVKSKDVDQKDIKTEQYSIEPRYENIICDYSIGKTCPPPKIAGYTVRQSAQVKVRNFKVINELLSGVVKEGANTVSQLSFTIDDPTEVQNQARAEAIEKAKEKAVSIAEAGGFTIGRLLEISENSYGYPQPMFAESMNYARGGVAMDAVAQSKSIEPGSQDVRIDVTLRYEIQ